MTITSKSPQKKTTPSSEDEDSVAETLAERRALHNSVERTRREALNSKFTHLAQQLPSLSHIHRPSKSVIISQCLEMVVELRETKAENEALRQEIHYLRMSLGGHQAKSPRMNIRLAGNTETGHPAEHRTFEPVLQSRSPGQYITQENSSIGSDSPRDFRKSISLYTGSVPVGQHQTQGSHRQVPSNTVPQAFTKQSLVAHWQNQELHSSARMQPPEIYGTEYSTMNLTGQVPKLNSDTSRSTNPNEPIDSYPIELPQYYPADYAPCIDLMMHQQQQHQQQQQRHQQQFMQAEGYRLT